MPSFKPPAPEAFPSIDLSAADVVIAAGSTPDLLDHGWNSSAWLLGGQVVKATSQGRSLADAKDLLDAMRREDSTLRKSIGTFMTEAAYSLAQQMDNADFHVVTVQPFVEGTPLQDFLAGPDASVEQLREFLAKSRETFKAEKVMPDIACIEDGFNVARNSNILIREDEDDRPELVDTTFGKTQRSPQLGWLWNRLIYGAAGRADKKLAKR